MRYELVVYSFSFDVVQPLTTVYELVSLDEITNLTFHANKLTIGRRRKPLPQLLHRGSVEYEKYTLQYVECEITLDKDADPHGFMVNSREFEKVR